MNPSHVRWRIERLEVLLRTMSRREALEAVAAEERQRPWEQDPRPAPPPLPMGGHWGLNPQGTP